MTVVKGRFSLDTNILVYAVDRDGGERHWLSMELVGRAARRDCVLTVQALAEFFHATTRKNLLVPSEAGRFVRDWLEVFEVASADGGALGRGDGSGGRAPALVLGRDALGDRKAGGLLDPRERGHAAWTPSRRRGVRQPVCARRPLGHGDDVRSVSSAGLSEPSASRPASTSHL